MAKDEAEYCDQFLGDYQKGCGAAFGSNLLWSWLVIAPSGQKGILVEIGNIGYCGSAGCSIFIFAQRPNGEYIQVFGKHGSVAALARIKIHLPTVYCQLHAAYR